MIDCYSRGGGRKKLRSSEFNELDLRRKTKIYLAPDNVVFENQKIRSKYDFSQGETRQVSKHISFYVRSCTFAQETIKTDVNGSSIGYLTVQLFVEKSLSIAVHTGFFFWGDSYARAISSPQGDTVERGNFFQGGGCSNNNLLQTVIL